MQTTIYGIGPIMKISEYKAKDKPTFFRLHLLRKLFSGST